MLLSIVTPCFNSEKYIEKCILSIKNQTCPCFEHIIVDGGSKDRTLEIIKKYEGTYNMRWISEPDQGMYDAINKGFKLANGDIYAWINSDDVYMPWTVACVLNCFKNHENVFWITGIPSQIDENGFPYFRSGYKINCYSKKCIARGDHHIRGKGAIQQESTFWRSNLWNRAGGIDIKYKLAGDYALWRKFAMFERLYTLPVILAAFRIHNEQKSSDTIAYCEEIGKPCNLRNFIWWSFNKLFKIIKIYNHTNRKMIIKIDHN